MEKERFIKYIELYNKYEKSEDKDNLVFTEDELKLIDEGNIFAQNNPELGNIMNGPAENRINEVEKFFEKQEELQKESEEMKAIKEAFGIDITNIENKKLDNGVEIFKFYAPKLQRVVVLQNRNDLSLVEQLKNKQANNEQFQTNNDINNTSAMLEEERQKDNVELKMIYPSEIDNYRNTIDAMKPEELKKLTYIIKNADVLNIKKINLQYLIYLDNNDNLREVIYDSEKDIVEDQDPNTLENNVEQINTSDRVDVSLSTAAQATALYNEYEDKPEEKENIEDYGQLEPDVQAMVVTYYEQPDLLLSMPDEERKKWEHYIELYKEHRNNQYRKAEMAPKQRILTRRENGAVSVVFLTAISIITVLAILLTVYLVYK